MNNFSTPRCATRLMVSILSCNRRNCWTTTLPSKFLTLLLLLSIAAVNNVLAQAYCTMICDDEITVSIGIDCETTIIYDMVLQDGDNPRLCSPNGKHAYKIFVFDEDDNQLPTSPTVPFEYVGRTLKAKAKHWSTGNACWTTIKMVDKVFPKLYCPPSRSVSCTESTLPAHTSFPTGSDCSEINFTYTDNYIDQNCGDPLASIERRWTVEDASGNRDFCTQTISIVQSSIEDIVFPQNLDGLELPPLECEWVAVDPASLLPEYTGAPQLNGRPIIKDGPCRLIPSYTDEYVESCEGTYKVLRTWKVVNWCTSEIITYIQIIKVVDTIGPTISTSDDITISTENINCEAMLSIPPATIVDGCSGAVRVTVQSSYGTLNNNGGTLQNVPVGRHIITYAAEDACGNISTKDVTIHVIDDDPPNVICQDQTVISLTGNGHASAPTQSFDNGTFDNCCLDGMGIRRMDSEDTAFGTTVSFSCDDIGTIVLVALEARDCYGNANSCMVEVSVQDKVSPAINCPADQTVDCDIDKTDLTVYGTADVEDNCGFEVAYQKEEQLDNCGKGTILRTWTATDKNGRVSSCTQVVTLLNNTPWNLDGQGIIWPADFETSECIANTNFDPEELPIQHGKPQIVGANSCALIASNYEDLVLDIEEPACYKILRTWSVIDWCNYDANYPEEGGVFQHTQIIKVLDTTNPVFEVLPENFTVDASGTNCSATVLLPTVTASDCSDEVTISVSGDLGTGVGPFNDVEPGNYTMTYTAADGCGNSSSTKITITVTDNKKPTPVCLSGISITVMPGTETTDPMIELWAADMNQKSFDNCTPEEELYYTIRLYDADINAVPTNESIFFNCFHLGVQAVELWVTDNQGNADFCITSVIVQDNMNACKTLYSEEEKDSSEEETTEEDNSEETYTEEENNGEEESTEEETTEEEEVTETEKMVAVGGRILTATGERLKNVEVTISHAQKDTYNTGNDGAFHFENIPTKDGYEVAPYKNDLPLNGVTTYDMLLIRKHILKIEQFSSPYELIAADVNRSGGITTFDLVELQKLILAIYDEFPNNTSWRFIVEDYEFENIASVLNEPFPESYIMENPEVDLMDLGFMAIKTGDVNNSANVNALSTTSSRSQMMPTFLGIENQIFEKGELVEIPVTLKQAVSMTGFQFALKFDERMLTLEEIDKNSVLDLQESNFGLTKTREGYINTSWHQPKGVDMEKGAILFTVVFTAKEKGELKDLLQISKRSMSPELYTIDDTIHPLALQLERTITISSAVCLYQNQPNPFQASTTIGFYLPNQAHIRLTIFNALGAEVKVINGQYSKGTHSLTIAQETFSQGGLYYYTLEVAGKKWSKKMLLLQ